METSEILATVTTVLTVILAALNAIIHKRLVKVEQFVKTDLERQ